MVYNKEDPMEIASLSMEVLGFLFAAAFIAGFIDTLAGGGGLIVLPALILSGIPPLLALGTNKLQGTMGTATASFMMLRNKKVQWGDVRKPMAFAFVGSVLGTIAVQFVNTSVLVLIIPFVLFVIAVYFIVSPFIKSRHVGARLSKEKYQNYIIPVIGWYDGMFGPGTGSFFALAGVSLRGQNIIDATAVAKTFNFATNVASLCVFLLVGKVMWSAGLIMMVGQVAGAWCGSKCLFTINPNVLRILVVTMCLAMLCKYLLNM